MRLVNNDTLGFLAYFMKAYPLRSALMVVLLLLAGMMEGVGVITLLPVLETAGGTAPEETSRISLVLSNVLGAVGLRPSLGILLAVIVTAITVKAFLILIAMRQVGFTVAQVTTNLRMELLRNLLGARWSHYASQSPGESANAISSEAHRAASSYREGCYVIAGILQIGIYLAVAVLVSWQMAIITFIVGGLFIFSLRQLIGMARTAGNDQTELMRSLANRLIDALNGIKPIRAMGREGTFLSLLEKQTLQLNDALRRQVSASETLRFFQEPALAIVLGVGLFVALTLGNQPFSSVLVLAIIFYRLIKSVNSIQTKYQIMTLGESAFWSLRDAIESTGREQESTTGTRAPPELKHGIRLIDVHFRYEEAPVLRGISLEIPAGELVALYGPSGVGKTTIADLVLGLHQPEKGRIEVDGVPLSKLDLRRWRREIGYVPQEVFLFHDTVFRNVTLGDDTISRQQVEDALRAAEAWSFLSEREKGMDEVLGEGGTKASRGQRQRISIARALVHRPRLLILDEATAALDPITEREVLDTIRKLRDNMTILAISHQPALRDTADIVYELEGGAIENIHHPARRTVPTP